MQIIFPLVVVLLNVFKGGLACTSTFKNSQNITTVQQDCTKTSGLATVPSTDELSAEDFDDKCLSKCILNRFQMIDNEGQIDKDVLLDFMEVNAPDTYLLKLIEVATSCAESSGADKIDGGSKTGKTKEECSPMQKFYSCFLDKADKMC